MNERCALQWDGNEQPQELPEAFKCLVIADSGCATSMPNHELQCEKGSVYDCESKIQGAGGLMKVFLRRGSVSIDCRWSLAITWKHPLVPCGLQGGHSTGGGQKADIIGARSPRVLLAGVFLAPCASIRTSRPSPPPREPLLDS